MEITETKDINWAKQTAHENQVIQFDWLNNYSDFERYLKDTGKKPVLVNTKRNIVYHGISRIPYRILYPGWTVIELPEDYKDAVNMATRQAGLIYQQTGCYGDSIELLKVLAPQLEIIRLGNQKEISTVYMYQIISEINDVWISHGEKHPMKTDDYEYYIGVIGL